MKNEDEDQDQKLSPRRTQRKAIVKEKIKIKIFTPEGAKKNVK